MDLGLTNATAVVVGGGRGMGLASARCLADDGARIAIIARSRDDLDAATADLTDRGSPDAVGIVADIRDADQVNGVFADLGERWNGELNVLVNAVGPIRQVVAPDAPSLRRYLVIAPVKDGRPGAPVQLQRP